ncbi:hypothetical protein COU54_01905 [Candidatus Pacearchaeota archaeon CG10_big_fil_rev_8_21_14_0_10_31_24]|nr:MAG: hypothetical protein COU54_01905 [Candidatus Pacearchaeota archaeon CG10_big_fil_rev_8_21_14_0_10_31_24]
MVNKRGFLKLVEAIVAILIVFGAVLTVVTTNRSPSGDEFCDSLPPLLNEISKNPELRFQIIDGDKSGTNAFLESQIRNPSVIYEVQICAPDDSFCVYENAGVNNAEVCAHERIISGTIDKIEPKKLKVFLFRDLN